MTPTVYSGGRAWLSGSGDRMKMRQLSPPSVNTAGYLSDQECFFTALEKHGLDVSLYASAFNPYPFLVPEETQQELLALQAATQRAMNAVVTHYLNDPRLSRVIALDSAERQLVEAVSRLPYRTGGIRPDFVHATDGRALVTEINARFALNGFLSSGILNAAMPELHSDLKPLSPMGDLETCLRERLGGTGVVGIVKSSEPGWDINLLRARWPERCELVSPRGLTLAHLKRWRSVIVELHQNELAHEVPIGLLVPLFEHPGILNDARTILIGHDKRLLSLLSTSNVLADYLPAQDVDRLRRHVIPTWVKGLSPETVLEAKENTRSWIAKPPRSGKGKGLVISHQLRPDVWRQTLDTLADDWILQPYIEQATFPVVTMRDGQAVSIPMKVVGLLPTLDEHAFGPGMYRAADDDIVNVTRGGVILTPMTERIR